MEEINWKTMYENLVVEYNKVSNMSEQINEQTKLLKEQNNLHKESQAMELQRIKLLEEQNDHIREIGHQLFHFVQEYLNR